MPPTKRTTRKKVESKVTPEELPEFGSNLVPRSKPKTKNWLWPLLGIIVVGLITYTFLFNLNTFSPPTSEYQAVFLTNGQVYFGKITKESQRYLYLEDVYYIQVQEQIQPPLNEGDQPSVISVPTLLKRGEELHSPSGPFKINREQVVAIEDVGENSQVRRQIDQLK